MKSGSSHTPETRQRIAAKATARMSPEERQRISAETKARMASPEVRQRIRDGMMAASGEIEELRALRVMWRGCRPAVRQRFLAELLQPLCT